MLFDTKLRNALGQLGYVHVDDQKQGTLCPIGFAACRLRSQRCPKSHRFLSEEMLKIIREDAMKEAWIGSSQTHFRAKYQSLAFLVVDQWDSPDRYWREIYDKNSIIGVKKKITEFYRCMNCDSGEWNSFWADAFKRYRKMPEQWYVDALRSSGVDVDKIKTGFAKPVKSPKIVTAANVKKRLEKGKDPALDFYKQGECIYLAQLQKTAGLFKIGRTRNIRSRIDTFQISSPFLFRVCAQISIEHLVDVDDCEPSVNLEKYIHEWLADFRVRGEWFALGPNEFNAIKTYYADDWIGHWDPVFSDKPIQEYIRQIKQEESDYRDLMLAQVEKHKEISEVA